jgi:hypothetical protein
MYANNSTHLGATVAIPEKSWYEKALEVAQTGYEAFAKREQSRQVVGIEKAKIEAELKLQAMKSGLAPAGFTRFIPSAFRTPTTNWVMPVMIGVVGLGAVLMLTGKKRR